MVNKLAVGLSALGLVAAAVVAVVVVLVAPTSPADDTNGPPQTCVHRFFGGDSTVCVCNSTYCDTLTALQTLNAGEVTVYTSSKAGLRFDQKIVQFGARPNFIIGTTTLTLKRRTAATFQTINGFGGAFTDAASMNIVSLSQRTQENLMRSYFSPQGIEYNIGRIPMASCDFSTRLYTYADEPDDFEMQNFELAVEDLSYKIPLMKRAMKMNDRPMKFFGSPWSAPSWMKTNGALYGGGSLIGEAGDQYHKAWALYFARFVEEYEKNGINMWGLTAQNEPIDGFADDFAFQCMAFTAAEQRDFVKTDLGPTLHSRGHAGVKLMIGDDQRPLFPDWAITVLNDTEAAKYVSGIGVHWYMDMLAPPSRLTETHDLFPGQFILGTEACTGAIPFDPNKVKLGDWTRGERYTRAMMQDLNNWVSGWVDWNLALDMGGGPNWAKNFVDAPIIVNADDDEFYKQPMFYHMGHFSKFIVEGAKRIQIDGPSNRNLKHVAFVDESTNAISLVVLNAADQPVDFVINDESKGYAKTTLPASSIQTFLWTSTNG